MGNAQHNKKLRVGRRYAVCSSYLEIKKSVINSETRTAEKKNAMAILSYVLKNVLDLLHPVMPFIAFHPSPNRSILQIRSIKRYMEGGSP